MTENVEQDRKKIFDLIEKLLAKADPAKNPPAEAEISRKRAMKLMMRHGITEHDVQRRNGARDEVTFTSHEIHGRYRVALCTVWGAVCMASGLGRVLRVNQRGSSLTINVYAHESDQQNLQLMCNVLSARAEQDMNIWWKSVRGDYPYASMTENERFIARRGFILAFAQGVHDEMKAARQEVENEEPGSALVLADRNRKVDNWLKRNVNVTRGRKMRSEQAAAAAGHAAGRRAAARKVLTD